MRKKYVTSRMIPFKGVPDKRANREAYWVIAYLVFLGIATGMLAAFIAAL